MRYPTPEQPPRASLADSRGATADAPVPVTPEVSKAISKKKGWRDAAWTYLSLAIAGLVALVLQAAAGWIGASDNLQRLLGDLGVPAGIALMIAPYIKGFVKYLTDQRKHGPTE